jgi:hypothetical protein
MNQLINRLLWHYFWAGTLFHSGAAHQQRAQATSDFGQQKGLTGQAQGTLGQFEGPAQQSPFYKSLLTTGIQSTSDAYQNARSNMRQQANQAGFGYAQPATQGADNQLQAREASDMAKIPMEAELGTAPLSLQAAGQTGQMGMGYGSQGAGLLGQNAQDVMGLYRQGIQSGGQVASSLINAYCPARGSMYLMADGTEKPVEELKVGELIEGIDGEPQTIEEIQSAVTPVLHVETEDGLVARTSRVHAFALPAGGFVVAMYALGKTIRTVAGTSKVTRVRWDGEDEVFNVITNGSHTYRADGIWALGVGEAERQVSMAKWNEIGDRLLA